MVAKVEPIGIHRSRLIRNIGRDHWMYDGKPVTGVVKIADGGWLKVWLFDFAKCDPDVQQYMIKETAGKRGITPEAAEEWLRTHDQAIPYDHIRVLSVLR